MTIINLDGRFTELQQLLRERYSSRLSILQSRPYFLEITRKEATKGQALKFLSEKEGISAEEIVAIGDSYNDLDMLQFAGTGVAVANAPQEVKNAADVITRAAAEDGVAVFRKYFWAYRIRNLYLEKGIKKGDLGGMKDNDLRLQELANLLLHRTPDGSAGARRHGCRTGVIRGIGDDTAVLQNTREQASGLL